MDWADSRCHLLNKAGSQRRRFDRRRLNESAPRRSKKPALRMGTERLPSPCPAWT